MELSLLTLSPLETGIKTIPMETKCKKAKWLSGEALQIAVKRREVRNKGEKERYKHRNAEYERTARRDKKAFFSDQCKEIEENNRTGKTRDLFKKMRDTMGNISCKDRLDKGQKWYGPNKKQTILRRGGKNTWKNCTKKIFTTRIITMV